MNLQTIISNPKGAFKKFMNEITLLGKDQKLFSKPAPELERVKKMKYEHMGFSKSKGHNLLYLSVLILFAFVTACSSTAKPQLPPPPSVKVSAPLQKQVTNYDQFTGRFRAIERVDVRARVDGYLQEIRFTDGELVEKGEVLFVIDQRPYKIALEQAQAQLKSAKARFNLTKKMLERAKGLRASGAVSQELLDRRNQEFLSAQAGLMAAEAALHSAELNLEFTKVKAPVSGKISQNFVSVGNLVSGGLSSSTLLTRIVSFDPIYFSFEVSEGRLIKYLQSDTTAGGVSTILDETLNVNARLLGEQKFTHAGQLDFVDNIIDQSTGTLTVRAIFNNDDLLLTPGMFATVRFAPTGQHRELLVPAKVIGSDQSRRYVLVVDDSSRVSRKFVETGILHNNMRIIEAGLTASDRVIISGFAEVRPGQQVTIKKQEIALAAEEH